MDILGIYNQITSKMADIDPYSVQYPEFIKHKTNKSYESQIASMTSMTSMASTMPIIPTDPLEIIRQSEFEESISDDDVDSILGQNDIVDLNIHGKLYTTLYEKYNDKYRKIQIKRKTKDDIVLFIPLRESYYIIKNEGEYMENNNISGDVVLEIITVNDNTNNDYIVKGNDICVTKYISLYEYLYGGKFTVTLFNNNIDVEHNGFPDKEPLIMLENKGMIYTSSDQQNEPNEQNYLPDIMNLSRGNLYILCRIKSLDSLKDNIRNISLND
jgi:hypothetical protein